MTSRLEYFTVTPTFMDIFASPGICEGRKAGWLPGGTGSAAIIAPVKMDFPVLSPMGKNFGGPDRNRKNRAKCFWKLLQNVLNSPKSH